jgi:hypothetical protein
VVGAVDHGIRDEPHDRLPRFAMIERVSHASSVQPHAA